MTPPQSATGSPSKASELDFIILKYLKNPTDGRAGGQAGGLSIARLLDRSTGRSLDGSNARLLDRLRPDRSVARSVHCLVARSVHRLVTGSLSRPIVRSLDCPNAQSLGRAVARSLGRSVVGEKLHKLTNKERKKNMLATAKVSIVDYRKVMGRLAI